MLSAEKLQKAEKTVGKQTLEELEKLSGAELKKKIFEATEAMEKVVSELEANTKYQQVKSDKNLLETGKREVNKRQKAIIKIAMHFLDEKGELTPEPAES